MKYTLYNKYRSVLDFHVENNRITKILKVHNIDYAPLWVSVARRTKYCSVLSAMQDWVYYRQMPDYRKHSSMILRHVNAKNSCELTFRHYGVTMSDQYWFKPDNEPYLTWDAVNFFTNPQPECGFLIETPFTGNYATPSNTTDGMLEKEWIDHKLYKRGYTSWNQEPANEYIASRIAEAMNLPCVRYDVVTYNYKPASVCQPMVDENEEYISAWQIMATKRKPNHVNDLEHYISILEEQNVPGARREVEGMFYLDKLLMNIDRHMNNFGVIRDVDTLEWVRICPIFDTGECLNAVVRDSLLNFHDDYGKYFTNTHKLFSKYPIKRPEGIPDLTPFVEEYRQALSKYSNCTRERINKLVEGLAYRIDHCV